MARCKPKSREAEPAEAEASPEPSADELYQDVYAEPYGPYTRSEQ